MTSEQNPPDTDALVACCERAREKARGWARLDETVLDMGGPDAAVFLESLSATTLAALAPGRWRAVAFANAQGRLIAWGRLVAGAERFLLVVPGEGAGRALETHLLRHRLRSRVTVGTRDDLEVWGDPSGAAWNPAAVEGSASDAGGRAPVVLEPAGVVIRGNAADPPAPEDPQALRAWRIREFCDGIVRLPGSLAGAFTIPALGPFVISLVTLEKGCFPGQEVVRKMLRLGHGKRVLAWGESAAPLAPGTPLDDATGRERATVLTVLADEGRFLVQLVVQLDEDSPPPLLYDRGRRIPCRVSTLMPPSSRKG